MPVFAPQLEEQQQTRRDERGSPLRFLHQVNYILAELTGYVNIADNERGIERGCYDVDEIWYSDRLISEDVTERLKSTVSLLENVLKRRKTGARVRTDRFSISSIPRCFASSGRTHACLTEKPRVLANFLPVAFPTFGKEAEWSISSAFCWLPSDFSVSLEGSGKLASPYINNIHPAKHQALYRIIEEMNGDVRPRVTDSVWGEDGPDGKPDCEEYVEELGEDEEAIAEEEWYNSKKILLETASWSRPYLEFRCAEGPSNASSSLSIFTSLLNTLNTMVVVGTLKAEWASEALQESRRDNGSHLSHLPQELAYLIKERLPTSVTTLKEAEKYRLALMQERTVFVQTHLDIAYNVWFNMCEH
ncbi:hypothetical protein B0H19DRAFT_1261775 [Mycena capillaripes]|nr:hypothetical protein B0H19DRAFT_1261775 [Mycena capillaripes]